MSRDRSSENFRESLSLMPMKQPIWFSPITIEEINQWSRRSMLDHLAIEFIAIGDDFLSAKMPVDTRTMQPMGILHGGASCVLAETIGSVASNCCVDLTQKACVGLEINVNHIKTMRGGFIIGTAKPLHIGKSTHIWDIQIRSETHLLVAVSRLTVAILNQPQKGPE